MDNTIRTLLAGALAAASMVSLAGCQELIEEEYTPITHYERFPITVETVNVKKNRIHSQSRYLKPAQVVEVAAFAADARVNAESAVTVSWPSDSPNGSKAAVEVAAMAAEQGVPKDKIVVKSYKGKRGSPLHLAFRRKVAVTKECGDWTDSLAVTGKNEAYHNYGCAIQHNIAEMVSNPEDFERPRDMPAALAEKKVAALKLYYSETYQLQGFN